MKVSWLSYALVFVAALSNSSCSGTKDIDITESAGESIAGVFETVHEPVTKDDLTTVAVTGFLSNSNSAPIRELVSRLLSRSGQFDIRDNTLHPEIPRTMEEVNFSQWRSINVRYLVIGRNLIDDDRSLNVEFELIDILEQRQLLKYPDDDRYCCRYDNVSLNNVKGISAAIADVIYEELTGSKGYFNNRLFYITVGGGGTDKHYRLYTDDVFLTKGSEVLSMRAPFYSVSLDPQGKSAVYVSEEFPDEFSLVLHDLQKAERRKIFSRGVSISSPDLSPDGKHIAFAMSDEGTSNIYSINIKGGNLKKLTNSGSQDSEPSWIDSKQILFTSDRTGTPQIHRLNTDKPSVVRLLTISGDHNTSPAASSDEKGFAFVYKNNNASSIAYQKYASDMFDILTMGPNHLSPNMSPNNQFVIFSTSDVDGSNIGVTSVDGRYQYSLSLPGEGIENPVWGN